MVHILRSSIIALLLAVTLTTPSHTTGFVANAILSDAEFQRSANPLGVQAIQSAIQAQNSSCQGTYCLKNYTEGQKNTAQVIYEASVAHNINPYLLLAILQAQTGLLTDNSPTQTQLNFAMGINQPSSLTQQINDAAAHLSRLFAQTPTTPYVYPVGVAVALPYSPDSTCGTLSTTIQNQATATLYSYPGFSYTPNAAALSSQSDTGDSCSSTGLRNLYSTYISLQSSAIKQYTVHRLYNPSLVRHLYTIDDREKDFLSRNAGWKYEGVAFSTSSVSQPCTDSTSPVYRFYSPVTRSHLYTISKKEYDYITKVFDNGIWRSEGVAYCASTQKTNNNTLPLYRFYSSTQKAHLYTTSDVEKNFIIKQFPDEIWKYEGVAYYVQ